MKKIINTKVAPAAIGPYSQGVSFGNLVMTSGQLPLDPTTMAFPEGGVREQTRQSLLNLKAVLEQSGASSQRWRIFRYLMKYTPNFLVTQERQRVHAFRLANYPKKPQLKSKPSRILSNTTGGKVDMCRERRHIIFTLTSLLLFNPGQLKRVNGESITTWARQMVGQRSNE